MYNLIKTKESSGIVYIHYSVTLTACQENINIPKAQTKLENTLY